MVWISLWFLHVYNEYYSIKFLYSDEIWQITAANSQELLLPLPSRKHKMRASHAENIGEASEIL